jgi:Histidine kinase-like ATPase domain
MVGDASSVHAARDFSLATLRRWGVAGRRDDIAAVVSELMTNALRHGRPDHGPTEPGQPETGQPESGRPAPRWPVRLGLVQPGPWVLCAVSDLSAEPPVPKELDYLAESGRGLHIVGALCDLWGFTTPSGGGKVVWALFATARLPASLPEAC